MLKKRPTVTKWNFKGLASYDLRRHVPAHVVGTINTPHEHEGDDNKPIWIIWKHVVGYPPVIDTLCDTPDSAVYHYGMLAGEIEQAKQNGRPDQISAHVERIPLNHRFASSLNDVFVDGTFTSIKQKTTRNAFKYKRNGD